MRSGKHDHGLRRISKRAGRERGCWVYIPAEDLERADIDTASVDPPFYRTWGSRRGSVLVRLYRER